MNWDQIREIEKEDFVYIGNHSHSHNYLVNYGFDKFKEDIDQSIKLFNEELGYNPVFILMIIKLRSRLTVNRLQLTIIS